MYSSVFNQISEIVPNLDGWGGVDKCQTMAAMVMALRPDVSVEIGVYGGRTFLGLALAHKAIGWGVAIGIDPWTNEAAAEGYEGDNKKFWEDNPINKIHDTFVETMNHLGVNNVIKVIRDKSDNVEPPNNIGLLHVDGQHTEQSVRDVKRFAFNVRVGGIVILDDISWENGSDRPVVRAELALLDLGFERLFKLGTGAVYQRKFRYGD